METTRVKINLYTGEIELEGSEKFVESQMEKIDFIIKLMFSAREPTKADFENNVDGEEDLETEESASDQGNENSNELSVPGTFGEWVHKFKEDVNDLDKCLLTAYYVQSGSTQNDFKTREVNKSLKEHGIKLSNPSTSLKRLIEKKLLFQTRKDGAERFMRVSQDGMQFLKSLLRK